MINLRLTDFAPGLLVPIQAYPPLIAGLTLLVASTYTFTSTFSAISLILFRLALAPVAIIFFWKFGYGSYETPERQVSVGMAVVGLYGIIRVIDTSIISILDAHPPRWVSSEQKQMPLPVSVGGRIFYALDLATSLRGNSWLSDRHWEWAPRFLTHRATLSRPKFLLHTVFTLLSSCLIVDVMDTINKSRTWDTTLAHPITTLSIPEQLVFSFSVCIGTALAIIVTYSLVAFTAVGLGSSPVSWPPMFDDGPLGPFASYSLTEFWARRWHSIFRRVFSRLSIVPLAILSLIFPDRPYVRKIAKALITFALSAFLHVMVMHRLNIDERWHEGVEAHQATFLDSSILKFFLVQPIGLIVEGAAVVPFSRAFFGEKGQRNATRLWAWCFLLWSGRYWSDVWVRKGMWQPNEKVVGYSVVRGLLYGQWTVT